MDPLIGQITLWPVGWIPADWHLCDGSSLSIQQYQALYAIIGTIYGGDGISTFSLPDLRGKVPIGTLSPTGTGAKSGAATASTAPVVPASLTIGINNLPSHTHTATFSSSGGTSSVQISIPVNNTTADGTDPSGKFIGTIADTSFVTSPTEYATTTDGSFLAPFDVSVPAGGGNIAVANTGFGSPLVTGVTVPVTVSTVQPSIALNYIIALNGIFPSRN